MSRTDDPPRRLPLSSRIRCSLMKPVVLTDVLAVGEFPTPDQIAILAKAGFKSILNNQPDGEVARFEHDAQVAAEALRHGLVHAYAPLSSRTPPPDELARYAVALNRLPAPVYAFCYSGSRAAAACALLLTSTMEVDAIVRQFDDAGFDLSGIKPWLEDARARVDAPRENTGEPPSALTVANATASKPIGGEVGIGERPAKATGNGARPAHGSNAQRENAALAFQAPVLILSSRPAADLPPMIVVEPRAAGYGGFAR